MKYLIKAITTNNRDLKTSLLLQFDNKSYIFNCPDGLQRMGMNQKIRFNKVRYIFLSSLHPDHFSGFPGLFLTAREQTSFQELANYRIGVFAPKNLKRLTQQGRIFLSGYENLEVYEYGKLNRPYQERKQEGEIIKIQKPKSFLSKREETKEEEKLEIQDESAHQFTDENLTVIPIELISDDKEEKGCYSFICMPKLQRGKFVPKKAIQLGCSPVVHFKLLTEGQQVTLDDGSIVYPFQVLEDPTPAQGMIFVFIPNENYLNSLILNQNIQSVFSQYYIQNIDSKKMEISVIYHSIPLKVLLNEKYREFMMLFGSKVQHIIDCQETNEEVMPRVKGFTHSHRQKLVCPSLIPLSEKALKNYELDTKEVLKGWLKDIQFFNSKIGLNYNLFPLNYQGIDLSQSVSAQESDPDIKTDNIMKDTIRQLLELKQQEYPQYDYSQLTKEENGYIDPKEPTILFLGTISMKPTQYRSASAIYLYIKGKGILMDCAEGSYGQLWDHFNDKQKVDEAILNMRVVFITHIHGDHQLGIVRIIQERDKLLQGFDPNNKLYIVTPHPMKAYLENIIHTNIKHKNMIVLVNAHALNPEPELYYGDETDPKYKTRSKCPQRSYEEVNELISNVKPRSEFSKEFFEVLWQEFNIKHMLAIETDHCIESYGCLIDSPDFGRLFYSGDTRPCQNIMNYCQNIRVLIHEATFEDELANDAKWKRHTTMGQAMDIGVKCNVWRTILTHFSPRYQKIAEITQQNSQTKTMVAFDHMRIRISQLEWAYTLLDIYQKFFKNEDDAEEKGEGKSGKQQQKDEDEEDVDENDYDEETKGSSGNTTISNDSQAQHTDEPAQFFNEFSNWRNNQSTGQSSNGKQTELVDIKPKPQQKKNLLTMSENEIEKQKNQIAEDDDLFKSFQSNKPSQPPPQQRQEQQQQNQLNSFFNNLANGQKEQQVSAAQQIFADVNQNATEQNQESDKKDVLEEKGWDDEINIDIYQDSDDGNEFELDFDDSNTQLFNLGPNNKNQSNAKVENNLNKNSQKPQVNSNPQSSKENQSNVFNLQSNQQKDKKDDFDDDFDYDDNDIVQPSQPIQNKNGSQQNSSQQIKPIIDFKKHLPSKDDIRKKNFIGDSIIAERKENEEDDLDDSSIHPHQGRKDGYMSKFSKISQIYQESTKEYVQQQKELIIKRSDEEIMRNARADIKKIEDFKIKFRNSAFGGVFTNSLSNVQERIIKNHKYEESQDQGKKKKQQQDNSEKSVVKVKEAQEDLVKQIDKEENENNLHVSIDIGIEEESTYSRSSLPQKKPKKKKKKVKVLRERSNHDDSNDEEEKQIMHEIQKHNNLNNQNKHAKKTMKDMEVVRNQEQVEEQVDWEALTKNKQHQIGDKKTYLNDEEEKIENERRQRICSIGEIFKYFVSEVDLSKELEQIQGVKEDFSRIGFMQRLLSCFAQPKLQSDELSHQRDILFALTKIKLDTSIAEHEILIKTIYKKLADKHECRLIGHHWVDIGFQGSDPKTDIRGAGILGLLHVLYYIDNYRETSRFILKYSQTEKVEFPLVVKMFEFTIIVIRLMREGRLYALCNTSGNVFDTVNIVYACLFHNFIHTYIRGNHNITHMNDLNTNLEKQARSNVGNTIRDYIGLTDAKAITMLKDAIKQRAQQQKEKLQQIAKQQPEFQVQEIAFNPKPQKQSQNQNQQRGRSYAENDEQIQEQPKKQKNNVQANSEFSQF